LRAGSRYQGPSMTRHGLTGERATVQTASGVTEIGRGGHHGLFEEESEPGEQGPGGSVVGLRVELVLFGDVQPGAEKEP